MADLQAAVQTQVKNVQAKTGRSIGDLHKDVAATGRLRRRQGPVAPASRRGYDCGAGAGRLRGRAEEELHQPAPQEAVCDGGGQRRRTRWKSASTRKTCHRMNG